MSYENLQNMNNVLWNLRPHPLPENEIKIELFLSPIHMRQAELIKDFLLQELRRAGPLPSLTGAF